MKPIFIKDFLPPQVLNIAYSYCVLKYSAKINFTKTDSQTKSLLGEYGDLLMETLLDLSTPVIEQNVGKKLFPTYSYLRVYEKESDLKIHKDRSSCEYTVALCLGLDPADKPYNIMIGHQDPTSNYFYYNEKKEPLKMKIEETFPMVSNNALIFQGQKADHWREKCEHDHYVTVFLHYVEQEGEYKEHKFDKRPMLGW
tara:strand:- start:26 stop:619 length:594 start_codon:yes stop_codon:yes gene_type:complete